jgi:hypothetical protein
VHHCAGSNKQTILPHVTERKCCLNVSLRKNWVCLMYGWITLGGPTYASELNARQDFSCHEPKVTWILYILLTRVLGNHIHETS